MKRTMILGIMVATALALCACASSGGGTASNNPQTTTGQVQQTQSTSAAASTETAAPSIAYDLSEYTMDGTLGGGYSYTATMKVGPWVRASDTEAVNAAWQAVGGKGSLPDINNFKPNGYATYDHFFENGTSVYAFGTMSITDTTQGGFSIGDSSQSLSVTVASPEIKQSNKVFDGLVQYGGSNFKYTHSSESYVNNLVHVTPDMKNKNWGPVPFAVCVAETVTPEYPEGNPKIMDATWVFGDNQFTIPSMLASN